MGLIRFSSYVNALNVSQRFCSFLCFSFLFSLLKCIFYASPITIGGNRCVLLLAYKRVFYLSSYVGDRLGCRIRLYVI